MFYGLFAAPNYQLTLFQQQLSGRKTPFLPIYSSYGIVYSVVSVTTICTREK